MATLHNLLVPVVQSEASLEAVTLAALVARQRTGRVEVVHVIEVARSLPLNAELEGEARRGEQLIRRAEEIAAAAGHPVSGTLLQAREAGQAICEEALDHDIDAIVLGVGKDGPGRTAEYVLKNATCAVWVVRQSMVPPRDHHHE
jgi:nucleotide-binding universal stress UspA family protein